MSEHTQVLLKPPAAPSMSFRSVSGGILQRKCACGGSGGSGGECEECKKKEMTLQRRASDNSAANTVPPIVHDVLRSPGQPLDEQARAFFEPRFGHDFSKVRIHTGSKAAESARAVNALAYTVGQDIVFQENRYTAESIEGKRLLAHELVHILQQNGGGTRLRRSTNGGESTGIQVKSLDTPILSRQGPWLRCHSMGIPCPMVHATHGTVCKLDDCRRAMTADLPFAVSPGVCIYRCEDGKVCACVLVGTSSSGVCTFTFCGSPGQANSSDKCDDLASTALAAAQQQTGAQRSRTATPEGSGPMLQAKLAISQPGDFHESQADHIANLVMQIPDPALSSRVAYPSGADSSVCASAPFGTIQRKAKSAPKCPTKVTFSFGNDVVQVPPCSSAKLKAETDSSKPAWSLLPDPTPVDSGTKIGKDGEITLGAGQQAGKIKARASGPGGCFYESSFRLAAHPTGIKSTSTVGPPSQPSDYGAVFEHTFISSDGRVGSLDGVAVGERFTNVPHPAASKHSVTAPTNPFGGSFTLSTGTLTPTAKDNWFLTAAGHLGGSHDEVTIGQAGINVGHFVQSASNPSPRQGLPADMTLLQGLHWFCPQATAAHRWQMPAFVTVAHSRTLRNRGGVVEFVTTVNGVEQVDAYAGPVAVFNANASPISTPRSNPGPAVPRTVAITVNSLPNTLPTGSPLAFSFHGHALGCKLSANPANDHAAVLTIGTSRGTVVIQAADSTGKNRARVSITIT